MASISSLKKDPIDYTEFNRIRDSEGYTGLFREIQTKTRPEFNTLIDQIRKLSPEETEKFTRISEIAKLRFQKLMDSDRSRISPYLIFDLTIQSLIESKPSLEGTALARYFGHVLNLAYFYHQPDRSLDPKHAIRDDFVQLNALYKRLKAPEPRMESPAAIRTPKEEGTQPQLLDIRLSLHQLDRAFFSTPKEPALLEKILKNILAIRNEFKSSIWRQDELDEKQAELQKLLDSTKEDSIKPVISEYLKFLREETPLENTWDTFFAKTIRKTFWN